MQEAQADMRQAGDLLKRHWGYDAFRPLQYEAIEAALKQQDALVVLPTGGGKSLCYQIPALLGSGLVLVVSPLIALMDDQVNGAQAVGLRAGALHSQRSEEERRRLRWAALHQQLDLLYVSPERLMVGDLLPELAAELRLIAVDEAHCISHWGHDFRPEYRQLATLWAQVPATVPRMALTATATPTVQEDIVERLLLRQPQRLIGHPDRPNLLYRALPRQQVSQQIRQLAERHPGAGGIVYALTRKEVEALAAELSAEGLQASAYHAGLEAEQRRQVQEGFVSEDIQVVVATIAFGMGIDRSNVRWVLHAGCPRSIEHYQQESGRAGRDGMPAECVLLFGAGDLATHRFFIERNNPPPERRQILEDQLRAIARYASAPVCRHRMLSEHFAGVWPPPGQAADDASCGACDVCLGETQSLEEAQALTIAQQIISAVWRTEGRFGLGQIVGILLGRQNQAIQRHQHDRLSVYGILRGQPEISLRIWIDQLIAQGFLLQQREDGYPLLRMTEAGKALCRGQGSVRLSCQVKIKKEKKGRKKTPLHSSAAPPDKRLFEALRGLRSTLARSHGVPPYIIFHDRTLHELASRRPRDLQELSTISGIGENKLQRYGAALIELIAEYQ